MINHIRRICRPISGVTAVFNRLMNDFKIISLSWGRRTANAPGPAVVFFPTSEIRLNCGLAGLISVYGRPTQTTSVDLEAIRSLAQQMTEKALTSCLENNEDIAECYLQGDEAADRLYHLAMALKQPQQFMALFKHPGLQKELTEMHQSLSDFIQQEVSAQTQHMGHMETDIVKSVDQRIEKINQIVVAAPIDRHARIVVGNSDLDFIETVSGIHGQRVE